MDTQCTCTWTHSVQRVQDVRILGYNKCNTFTRHTAQSMVNIGTRMNNSVNSIVHVHV